jgi:hypothetical protein
VTLAITTADAAEPNTAGSFTISRTGDTAAALPVTLNTRGSAQPGVDYAAIPLSTNIPAGAAALVINVTPIDDQSGEPAETVKVNLVSDPAYEVFAPMTGTINLADDGDITFVGATIVDPVAYEGIPAEELTFSVYRTGDTSADLNVNVTFGGTAAGGADFVAVASPLTIPAGSSNVLVSISGTADANDELDETVILTVVAGDGYSPAPGSESVTGTIHELGPLLFSEDFESDHMANYDVLFRAANDVTDYRADFFYDYSTAATPVPPSPRGTGTTRGLLVTVNKNDAANSAASVNVYPKDETFAGDYLLKFDMFMNYGTDVGGTTEAAIFGLNHSGTFTNRYNAAGSDGVWFMIETDASEQGGRSYVLFMPTNTTAVPPFEAKPASQFESVFPSPPFLAAGAPSGDWVDVSVQQQNDVITWKINNHLIFQKTNSGPMTSGKFMLGHMDTFNSTGSTNNFTVFDNVRVYQLDEGSTNPPVQLNITGISKADTNVVIQFTTTGSTANLSVEGSATVDGIYAREPNAQITPGAQGQVTATIPITTPNRFFRIRQG